MTVPGAAYDYPKAELGKRILAYIVDGLVASVPLIVTAPIAFIPLYRYIASDGWISPSGFSWVLIIIGLLIGFGWAILYTLLRDGFGQGQSIGKKMTGLMVVRLTDNLPCTKKDSFVRNVVAVGLGVLLSWIPVLNFFAAWAEPIIALINQKGMRLGDRLANTQVVAVNLVQRRS